MPRRRTRETDPALSYGPIGRRYKTNDDAKALEMVRRLEEKEKGGKKVHFSPEKTIRSTRMSTRRDTHRDTRRDKQRSTHRDTRRVSRRSTHRDKQRNTRRDTRRNTRREKRKSYEGKEYRVGSAEEAIRIVNAIKMNDKEFARNLEKRREKLNFGKYRQQPTKQPMRSKQPRKTQMIPKGNIITMNMKRFKNPNELVSDFVLFILGRSKMEVAEFPGKTFSYSDLVSKFKEPYYGKRKDHFWENTHSTIQWIFPIITTSKYAPNTSPILPRSNKDFIRTYGEDIFKKVGNIIETAAKLYYDYIIRYKFLGEKFDHNFLRSTRVANCLKYFGKNKTAKKFLRNIIAKVTDRNGNTHVEQRSYRLWLNTLADL